MDETAPRTEFGDAASAARWLLQADPQACALLDLGQTTAPVLYANTALLAWCQDAVPNAVSLPLALRLEHPEPAWSVLLDQLRAGQASHWQGQAFGALGELLTLSLRCHPLPGGLAVARLSDDSAVWQQRQALRLAEQRERRLLDDIDEAVLRVDSALVVSRLNPAAEALLGVTADAAAGCPLAELVQLVQADNGAPLGNPLLATLLTGSDGAGSNAALRRSDGSLRPVRWRTLALRDQSDAIVELLLILRDGSEVSVLNQALAHLAWRDALTELPNRGVFDDRLAQALALAQRYQHGCAVLLLTVADHAQRVADQGQEQADQVLQALAQRLRALFRRSDTVCRIADQGFGVVMPLVREGSTAELLSAKALTAAAQPGAQPLALNVGVAIFPADGDSVVQLLARANPQA